MGTRLKSPRITFSKIKSWIAVEKKANGEKGVIINLKIRAKRLAIAKFEKGPAKEIIAASRLGFLRLKGSKTTGFAHPKGMTGAPNARRIKRPKRSVVPIGS